jgi:hypothetical protein
MGLGVQTAQEIIQNWDKRAARLRSRMEITGNGLALGAGTILANASRGRRGGPKLALHNGPRVMALLATAYERPIGPHVLAKIERACKLWNEGEKALAHIHLAHARLPHCDGQRALRLFAADELLESGVTPQALLKAQGFGPALLSFLKYNPDQPRVPAGNGRESGRWTSEGAAGSEGSHAARSEGDGSEGIAEGRSSSNITVASNEKEQSYEERRKKGRESDKEDVEHGRGVPLVPEGPLGLPSVGVTETEQSPEVDPNKLHHVFDNPDHPFGDFVSQYGSREAAFRAIEDAAREAVLEQGIAGQFRITIEVGGRRLIVKGNVMDDGTVKIGTVSPWNN